MKPKSFGVCLHFEDNDRDVWSGRPVDLDAWRYALRAFGGNRLAVVNLTGAELAVHDEHLRFEQHASLEEFVDLHEKEHLVFVELGGPNLRDFSHPGDCWYVFGGTSVTLPRADITVPTCGVVLHPVHAAQIVLWDRASKESA
jgi:hypothetical protein